jgi:Tfp pilus assembly protein PilX
MQTTRPLFANRQRGSALLAMLILVVILAGLSGSYMSLAFSEFQNAHRNARLQAAMNVAEASAEEAIQAILNNQWTGWTALGGNRYVREMDAYQYYGETTSGRIYVDFSNPSRPILVCEGLVNDRVGQLGKQVRMDLETRGLFANGLTSRNSVSFKGNNVLVDSYNSGSGAYNILFNRNDRGTVGSISVEVDSVDIQNAYVFGFVATGGGPPKVGANGTIRGKNTPLAVKVDATRVSTDFYANFDTIATPSAPTAPTSLPPGNVIGTPSGANVTYNLNALSIGNTQTLTVNGPVTLIVKGNVDIKGVLDISQHGRLTVYVEGDMDVGGTGIVNGTQLPSHAVIFGTAPTAGGQTIKLHGNGAMHGAVYAPNANLDLKGGGNSGEFFGAAVANDIFINGNYEFHYDEALDSFNYKRDYRIARWRELVAASERVDFTQVTALPQLIQPYQSGGN